MRNITKAITMLLGCGLLLAAPVRAQWEYGGKIAGYYSSYTGELAVTGVGGGRTVIVWESIWGGDGDIFASLADSAGYLRWGEGGLLVCEDNGIAQTYPAVLADGNGGIFVVWCDWRHTPEQGIALYGQRLDSLGNKLWNPAGVRLTAADTLNHDLPKLYDDGQGGFIAVFRSRYDWIDINVGAQRISPEGTVLWDTSGIVLTRALGWEYNPMTCKASDSAFVTIWLDDRFDFYPDSSQYWDDVYMQSFDLAGNILWAADGIPVIHYAYDQGGYDLVPDGQGGVIVVWLDHRHMGYNEILYANRFSPSGQWMWQENGRKLGDEHFDIAYGSQAFKYGQPDTLLFRWEGGLQGAEALRFSGLDINGNFLWPGVLFLDNYWVTDCIMDQPGIFKYTISYTDSAYVGVVGRKCDIAGSQYWPDHPFITRDRMLFSEKLISDDNGGLVDVWKQSTQYHILITRIYVDGYVGGDTLTAVFEPEAPPLPESPFNLSNYPNPFNSATLISFDVNLPSNASLRIFDALGRIVHTVEFGRLNVGRHSYLWDVEKRGVKIASGSYIMSLEIGNRVETRRMMVLK